MNGLYKALVLTAALPLAACGGNAAQTAEREPPKPRVELADLTVVPTGFGKTQTTKYTPVPGYVITWASEPGARACADTSGIDVGESTVRLREAQFDEAIRTATPVKISYAHVMRDYRDTRGTLHAESIDPLAPNGCLQLRNVAFQWR